MASNPITMTPARTLIGYIIRHGDLNITNCWDGWGSYTLSPEGIEHANKAGQWLSFEGKIGRIVASDVPRTLQTADIIMNYVNPASTYLTTDPNLRPLLVAGFTGKEKTPERMAEFKHYLENIDEVIPDGESVRQHMQRVQVILTYMCSPYKGLPTVVVTHNSSIKNLMGKPTLKQAVSPGGIVGVWMTETGEIEFDVLLGESTTEEGVS